MIRTSFKIDYKAAVEGNPAKFVCVEGSTYEDGDEPTVDVHDTFGNIVYLPVSLISEITACMTTIAIEHKAADNG